MMMSPESYHEENLRWRSQEEKFLMTAEAEDDNKEEEGPKLTLLNMRWRNEDAAAFGPIEGDTFAELMVMDENGRLFFILIYHITSAEKILISEYAMFDILLLFTVESYSRYLIREKNAQESASLLAGRPFLCIPFLYF